MNIKKTILTACSLLIITHMTFPQPHWHAGVTVSSYDEPSLGTVATVFGGIALGAAAIAGSCALYEYSRSDDDLLHEARQAYHTLTRTYAPLINEALDQDTRYIKSEARALGNRINRFNGTPLHNTVKQLQRDLNTYKDCMSALRGRNLVHCIRWESDEYDIYTVADDIYYAITNSREYAEEVRYKNSYHHCHIHTHRTCWC